MKTITCHGYAIIIFLSIILTPSLLYSQSTIVYDAGTLIDVGTGADVCADVITINGTLSGGGTFCDAPVAVENEEDIGTPKEFSLAQNYPNPFNPITKISWQSPVGSWQTLKIYDVLGNEVATFVDEYKPAGSYEVEFDGSHLSSGIYFYELRAGEFVQTKKLILMK